MPVKAILIALLLLLLVWVPRFLNLYNTLTAILLTLGFIIAGFIGAKVSSWFSNEKGEQAKGHR